MESSGLDFEFCSMSGESQVNEMLMVKGHSGHNKTFMYQYILCTHDSRKDFAKGVQTFALNCNVHCPTCMCISYLYHPCASLRCAITKCT